MVLMNRVCIESDKLIKPCRGLCFSLDYLSANGCRVG